MPFCMECGVKISQDAFFCPSCGTKQIIFPIENKAEFISEKPNVQNVVTDNASDTPTIKEPDSDISEVIITPVKKDKIGGETMEDDLPASIQEAAPIKFAETAQQAGPLQEEISAAVQDVSAAPKQIIAEQKAPDTNHITAEPIHPIFHNNNPSVQL